MDHDEEEREPCPWCGEKWECTPCCRSRFEDGIEDEYLALIRLKDGQSRARVIEAIQYLLIADSRVRGVLEAFLRGGR